MRIGLDAYHASRPAGGIARYIRGLVPALAAAAPESRFTLFANRLRAEGAPWDPGLPNTDVRDLRWPRRLTQWGWDVLDWPAIEQLLGPLDLFHGMHFVLPAARRAKLVLTVHDLTYLRHPEYFSDRALNERGYRRELPRALARADAVVAVSEHTKRDLVDLLRVPAARIRVVLEGVEPSFFVQPGDPATDSVLARLGLVPPYLVCLVGTPEPRKNLVRAVAAARLAAPRTPLVLIGPVEPIRTLLGADVSNVRMVGTLSDRDLPHVLHGAACALYPSLYEGFGLPALEAMAAGVPLVTSDRSALPEVVGDAAVLVDPESVEAIADGLRALLADEARRARLVEAGLARARELSWPTAARRVLALYRELVGGGGAG